MARSNISAVVLLCLEILLLQGMDAERLLTTIERFDWWQPIRHKGTPDSVEGDYSEDYDLYAAKPWTNEKDFFGPNTEKTVLTTEQDFVGMSQPDSEYDSEYGTYINKIVITTEKPMKNNILANQTMWNNEKNDMITTKLPLPIIKTETETCVVTTKGAIEVNISEWLSQYDGPTEYLKKLPNFQIMAPMGRVNISGTFTVYTGMNKPTRPEPTTPKSWTTNSEWQQGISVVEPINPYEIKTKSGVVLISGTIEVNVTEERPKWRQSPIVLNLPIHLYRINSNVGEIDITGTINVNITAVDVKSATTMEPLKQDSLLTCCEGWRETNQPDANGKITLMYIKDSVDPDGKNITLIAVPFIVNDERHLTFYSQFEGRKPLKLKVI